VRLRSSRVTVFIARHFEPARFAAIVGHGLAVSMRPASGLLANRHAVRVAGAVPRRGCMVWGFWVLTGCSVARVGTDRVEGSRASRSPSSEQDVPRESLGRAALTFASLFKLPHTPGIVALSFVCYASFITLRGLWLARC